MKIVYHLVLLGIMCAACLSFGLSFRALVDAPCLAIILTASFLIGMVFTNLRSVGQALLYLLHDKKAPQSDTSRALAGMAVGAMVASALLAMLAAITIFSQLNTDARLLGRSIGFSLLSPFYGLYLAGFVFYPFSVRARNP